MSKLQYTRVARQRALQMLNNNGNFWTDIFFGDRRFYSAAYFDLLCGLWESGSVTKSEALYFIKAIRSSSSVAKCLNAAIEEGFVVERKNPNDARSQLVELSPDMKGRLDGFFDRVIDEAKELVSTTRE